jgi:hypothetical protein
MAELVGAIRHHPSRSIPTQAGSVGAGSGVAGGTGVAVGGTNQQTADEPSQSGRGVGVGRGASVGRGVAVASSTTGGALGEEVAKGLAGVGVDAEPEDVSKDGPPNEVSEGAAHSRSVSAVTTSSRIAHGRTVARLGRDRWTFCSHRTRTSGGYHDGCILRHGWVIVKGPGRRTAGGLAPASAPTPVSSPPHPPLRGLATHRGRALA